ncbi:hypothetical protein [Halomonas salipaludis]|uniref:DUF2933 domain-containing protein n=1 Tax=Halomonas salipaludis TaxID=2032625 RepID=A0A2A2EX51_9GAMM|nr:hypothetical protein [Halomonas salipaludis]PAU77991.1 hypothetical protein CK498_04430 [Halomonas salipaludis]
MNRLHHWMMTACLVLMGAVMLLLMWRAQSLSGGAWLLLPMALCLGAHWLLHRHCDKEQDTGDR